MNEPLKFDSITIGEDFPVVTTLTMVNRRKIDVAESIEVIEDLVIN